MNSPYYNKRRVLSGEEAYKLKLMSDEKLDQLAEIILQRVKSKMPPKINWEKVGEVTLVVACGAALVVATVASAGTIGVAAGVAAAGWGVSSATAATISTVAVAGTYCAAGTMGAITLSNAGEVITDGHNVIRDDMFTPVFGQEKANEIYQNTELLATLASMGITEFAARNPQFRPLPKSKNLAIEKSPKIPGFKPNIVEKHIDLDNGLKFSSKALEHMKDSNRQVPITILKDAIKYGEAMPDPRGSNATMYYTQMYRNGNLYNLEVLYDESTNVIYHFEYARKAMGNLPEILK